jgi:hypothetical protein
MIAGGVAQGLYFLTAMGADESAVVLRKSFCFHFVCPFVCDIFPYRGGRNHRKLQIDSIQEEECQFFINFTLEFGACSACGGMVSLTDTTPNSRTWPAHFKFYNNFMPCPVYHIGNKIATDAHNPRAAVPY